MKCFCLGQQLIKSETKGLLFLINNSKRKLCIIINIFFIPLVN